MRADTKTSYSVVRMSDKTDYGFGAKVPEPRIDYAPIRFAKLKCNECQNSEITCNRNVLTCDSFIPVIKDGLDNYAWDRIAEILE